MAALGGVAAAVGSHAATGPGTLSRHGNSMLAKGREYATRPSPVIP